MQGVPRQKHCWASQQWHPIAGGFFFSSCAPRLLRRLAACFVGFFYGFADAVEGFGQIEGG